MAVFDCLHDMGDPVGAAAHVLRSLHRDGTWMIVEPFANDELKDNLDPVGRVYYLFSTLLCRPVHDRRKSDCAWARNPVRHASRGDHQRGIRSVSARHGNPVQYCLRSPAVSRMSYSGSSSDVSVLYG